MSFEKGTGQLISPSKCSILFSLACSVANQNEIKSTLAVTQCSFEEKYLGLPTPEGRMKAQRFQPIKDRFRKRLNVWDKKYMSMGAKEELIKSVAQALTIYVMGVFKLPAAFHEDYMQIIRQFWWGEDEDKRKVHWASWDTLTKPKQQGGMGFRDSVLFSQALLARQAWRLLQNPQSLAARLMKAIYYPRGNLIDTVFRSDASPVWHGIEHGLDLLKQGIVWRVGDGKNIRIWRDNWLPRKFALKPQPGKSKDMHKRVNQLVNEGTGMWNTQLIHKMFYPHDAEAILQLNVPETSRNDFLAWHYESNGVFSVKSAYKLAYSLKHNNQNRPGTSSSSDSNRTLWKLIWNAPVPNKVRIFGWRTACDNLATKKNKFRRNLETDSTCSICGREAETSFHATVACTKSRALREEMRKKWDLPS
jgi:hypothetical protein